MGRPTYDEELDIMERFMGEDPLDSLMPVASAEDIKAMQEESKNVFISPDVRRYILNIVTKTREHAKVLSGVSTRGTLALMNASKAYALVCGRDYVIPDDVNTLSVPVLSHRLLLSYGQGNSNEASKIIREIVSLTEKPTENFKR